MVKNRKKPATQMMIVLSLGIAIVYYGIDTQKTTEKYKKGKSIFNEETGPVDSGPVIKA
jgi:hypothetical protein